MKKILLSLAATLLFSFAATAQTVDQVFAKYAKESRVERVKIGKLGMILAGLFGGETMGVNAVEVLDLKHCTPSLKEELSRAVRTLNDPDYEMLVTANNSGEHVRILVKMKNDSICEMVVLAAGNDEATLVRISGKIRMSDIEQLIKN
ncbi:MAG: DUF4252 domain-containing protein [Tannerella sp.]|jgi:hypothetical protein|nr:DUF4252 domain-containing protein [Tannerella sp.]